MQFTREVNRLLFVVLLAFGLVSLSTTYWALVGPDMLLQRDDNPRLVEKEAAIQRGSIFDRNQVLLVQSIEDEQGALKREYLYPQNGGALGYFSLRYGVGGAEGAYDAILRGDDLPHRFVNHFLEDVLHQSQVGSDIQLTLDIDLQQTIRSIMSGQQGAVIVMDIPGGDILAMVSLPDYNANTLDIDWDKLIATEGKPFFNRLLQGNYQPGGALQTILMASAILTESSLDSPIEDATQTFLIDDLEIGCATQAPTSSLTLKQAYAYGCPYPFIQLSNQYGETAIDNLFKAFRLQQPPTLAGFVAIQPTATLPTPTPPAWPTPVSDSLLEKLLGQGQTTVTPLTMVSIAAAIINDGNAPQPYTLTAIRRPDAEWEIMRQLRPTIPITTAETADKLRQLMLNNVSEGAAQQTIQPDIEIGGHASVAYSGKTSHVWFIGFREFDNGTGVAVAVVLENTAKPQLAAFIGTEVLQALPKP